MSNTSKNLGLISAVKSGINPPNNKELIWFDTNFNPPKRKMWDESVQEWGEVVFISSPLNSIKRMIVNEIGVDQTNFTINNEDLFVKTDSNSNTFLNLVTPNFVNLNKSLKISNLTNKKILLNHVIIGKDGNSFEEIEAYKNCEIICLKNGNQINWYLLSYNSL